MNKRQRIEYLISTMCVVFSGFLLYGILAYNQPLLNDDKWLSFFVFGLIGGFGFSICLSAILLSIGYFRKRGLVFKIIAALLWPLTFGICFYVGVLFYLPYQIYNIIKIVQLHKDEKTQKMLDENL